MKLRAKVIINASAQEVFNVISEADLYAHFEPNCKTLHGKIALNELIKLDYKNTNNTCALKVVSFVKNHKIIFKQTLPLGLFSYTITLNVIAKDDFTTEFHREDESSGLFLRFLKRKLPDQNYLEKFCSSLKNYIEYTRTRSPR
jgi:uncharacterized protein YndB with AHSA1/START domain